jgi:hypothetical protein
MSVDAIRPPKQTSVQLPSAPEQLHSRPQTLTRFLGGMVAGVLLLGTFLVGSGRVAAVIGHAQGGASSHSGHAIRQPFANGNGLVAWYPLDGNVNDASGNGNNGSLVGAPLFGAGKFGTSVILNGSTQYVSIPTSSSLAVPGSLTISLWMNPTDWADSLHQTQQLVAKSNGGAANNDYELRENGGSQNLQFLKTIGGSQQTINSNVVTIPNNQWTHIVVTFNASTFAVNFYLNGAADGGGTFTSGSINTYTQPLTIGTRPTGNSFNGSIDDVRIYNRVLSTTEISQLYQGSQPTNCDQTCVGWWKLDGSGTSTVATDSSGNGNTGTLTNFTFDGTTNGWVPGIFSGGVLFNGSSDYVNDTSPSLASINGSFTMSAWVSPINKTTLARTILVVSNSAGQLTRILTDGTSRVSLYVNNTRVLLSSSTATLPNGVWSHLAATYSPTYAAIYLNGSLMTSTTSPAPIATGFTSLRIGADAGTPNEWFYGSIDDVRIYNRALAPYEIYEQYAAGRS